MKTVREQQQAICPLELTRLLEAQQREAILKWVKDPFGNQVKTFPVVLPEHLRKKGDDKPLSVCLSIFEVRLPKTSPTRATRLPDNGAAYANGKWTWGAGNSAQEAPPETPPPAE